MELEEAIMDMYTHLHVFQELVANIMEQHKHVQVKNIHMETIREGMNEIKQWFNTLLTNIEKLVGPTFDRDNFFLCIVVFYELLPTECLLSTWTVRTCFAYRIF
jgi:methanogenic corrinoid protein MtbC1